MTSIASSHHLKHGVPVTVALCFLLFALAFLSGGCGPKFYRSQLTKAPDLLAEACALVSPDEQLACRDDAKAAGDIVQRIANRIPE